MYRVETQAFNIGSYGSNAWNSGNPHSGVYSTELAKTIDRLQGGNPACHQGGTVVVERIDNGVINKNELR